MLLRTSHDLIHLIPTKIYVEDAIIHFTDKETEALRMYIIFRSRIDAKSRSGHLCETLLSCLWILEMEMYVWKRGRQEIGKGGK